MHKTKITGIKKLRLEDYQVGRILQRCGLGKVKVAKDKNTSKFYALKLLNKADIIKYQQINSIFNECLVHSQLGHPFIVKFEGLAQDSRYLCPVLQLINGGDLFSYLRSVEAFSTEQSRFYAATVILCLEYLHQKNIIFRDLKPENFLIANDGYLKLIGFGFAKELVEGRTFTVCGTPEYTAPEVILNHGHGKAADWWSLGVLIYEMHAGIDPFYDQDPMGVYKNVLSGKVTFSRYFDKDIRSLIKHLLIADLSKRYGNLKSGRFSIDDIKFHRWFSSFIWEDLLSKRIQAPYIPTVRSCGDVSNFQQYPDSGMNLKAVASDIDPFLSW